MLSRTYAKEERMATNHFDEEKILRRYARELKTMEEYRVAKKELRDFLKKHKCKNTEEYLDKYDAEDDDLFWEIKDKYEDFVIRFVR